MAKESSKSIEEKSRAKAAYEKAKMAERKTQILEGKLIRKEDVIKMFDKILKMNCDHCSPTLKIIRDNVANYRLSD